MSIPPVFDESTPVPSMDIAYTDWKCRTIALYPRDTKSPILYTIDTHMRKPHFVFKRGDTDEQIGTANMHWSSKLDFEANKTAFTIDRSKGLKCKYTYPSPALGHSVTWSSKSGWTTVDFIVADENDMPLARWTTEGMKVMSWSRLGRLEFDESRQLSQEAKDEMVIVGLTLGQRFLTQMASGSASSSSSASVAAAVSV